MIFIQTLHLIFLLTIFSFCSTPQNQDLPITSGHETINTKSIQTNEFVSVKPSRIPGAGMGVFTIKDIPKDTVIGEYKGKFLKDDEYWNLVNKNEWHYVMGLDECSYKFTNGIKYIDGRNGNFTTRINHAPVEFQNVKFQKICEFPYVQVITTKDIKKDEEIYVDYGPNYIYDFMEIPEVKDFFARESKKIKK